MEDFDTGQAEDVTLRLGGSTGAPESNTEETSDTGVFAPGRLFLNKYNIQSHIGSGGMGVVYRCSQVFMNKDLAIKTLNPSSMSDEALQRFQTEAKAAGSLSHPNLVSVYDFGVTEEGAPYMVMDYVPGKTLQDVLFAHGQMSLDTVIDIFIQCADGLAHAHEKGVFHRDIKPSNIVLLHEENIRAGSIRILDFGIAKIASNSRETQELTKTGVVIGSPLYMSPEQSIGKKMDERTDIYSLGCVLFECLCGVPPFQGDTIIETLMLHQTEAAKTLREASLGREFPQELEDLVSLMMVKNVNERIETMRAVHERLLLIKQVRKSEAESFTVPGEKRKKAAKDRKDVGAIDSSKFTSMLLGTPAVISAVVLFGGALAVFILTQLAQPQAPTQKMVYDDGSLTPPDLERVAYDEKTNRALTEARSRGLEMVHIAACEFSQSQFEMLVRAKWARKFELVECSRFTAYGLDTILKNEIEALDLRESELNDECLGAIARCKSLVSLSLNKCKGISQVGLMKVATMKRLKTLDLTGQLVTDEVLKTIVENVLHCSDLNISQNALVGDNSCRILGRYKEPMGLNLSYTSVSDEGLKHLGKNILYLEVAGNKRITDQGIETLVKNCPGLRVLQMPGTSVTAKGIHLLLKLKNLHDVEIGVIDADAQTRARIRDAYRARNVNTYNF